MDLKQALRLSNVPRLALVGAGGKSTALFQLARQLKPPVIVTASTHVADYQLSWADQHLIVESLADLPPINRILTSQVTLITGPEAERKRMAGLDSQTLSILFDIAETEKLPLLVEADGSRRRPLKAPDVHEPPIPDFVTSVVVVAGLAGLGKPLTAEWVHRPERFANLAGCSLSEEITFEALLRVLTHPRGGLKNIPSGAVRTILFNQVGTQGLQARSKSAAARLLKDFQAVVIADLNPMEPQGYAEKWSKRQILAVHERVAGVILAAGASSRFGQPKLLLEWHGRPLIRHVAEVGLQAGLEPLVVVTGEHDVEISSCLHDMPVIIVHNPEWREGQSTSLHTGLREVPQEAGAVVFLLADQPLIPAALIRSLVDEHARNLAPLVAPVVDGQRANPVLFDRTTFLDLMAQSGDVGGRGLFSKYQAAWVPWHDASARMDVDTPEDYERLLSEF
jgi:molybdenum cofactor cytidylyltransferase